MLEIEAISKKFNDLSVIEDLSLRVKKNSLTILTGPSGCGKTTLFNILMGNLEKDSGNVSWNGERVSHLGMSAAFMQQKDLLLPWLNLFDNAMLPVKFSSMDLSAAADKCRCLFRFMGIDGFEKYLPPRVSGGMKKRCVLARTLMFNRHILLLDEPFSSLDTSRRNDMYSLLLSLQKEFGKTILMITHDIDEALFLGDEILVSTMAPMKLKNLNISLPPKPRRLADIKLAEIKEELLSALGGGIRS